MKGLRPFLRAERAATAVEFALVLPAALLLLMGTIDAGRYMWRINQLEKAVQMGARYAVATAIVPAGLNSADYTTVTCNGATLTPGDTICKEALGVVTCAKASGTLTCTCDSATGNCPSVGTADASAWGRIVQRVRFFAKGLGEQYIRVKYTGSGIGYVSDPATSSSGGALSDVAPIVTVEVTGAPFRSFSLLGKAMRLPRVAYSLTLEDGDGVYAN